jgi:asparagine synthetase B (glutamine-hydrolysing)
LAELRRDGDDLVVALSGAEKAEAVHGDIRVRMSSVSEVDVVDDVVHAVQGHKSVGAAWPGRFAIGSFRGDGKKTFAVVHHKTTRGVRVTLEGEDFDELVVGCEDPEEVAREIGTSTTS